MMEITITFNSIVKLLKDNWFPVILPAAIGIWSYITTTLSLAISAADKDADGNLTNAELEELTMFLIRNAKTPWIKLVPEGFIRKMVRRLCSRRKESFTTEVPPVVAEKKVNESETVTTISVKAKGN